MSWHPLPGRVWRSILCLSVGVCLWTVGPAAAIDRVELKRDGRTIHVEGELLVEAQDGGLLLQTAEGVLWAVQPDELVGHEEDERPLRRADAEQLANSLLDELGDGFRIHTTAHYVIAYNTSKAYAQWCGALYERLYKGFHAYWGRRLEILHEPEQPLVAVVFDDQESFVGYARQELGEAAGAVIGYYSLRTNRVVMYDLTATATRGRRLGTAAQVNAVLSRPQAAATVATIIHEATHQIAFNSGVHQRYADIPMWLSEGLALYFETPDLSRQGGWRTIGAVNRPRLVRFRRNLRSRPDDALPSLIAGDERFRDTSTALDAYADAWALTYFLNKRYPDEYDAYLEAVARKRPLVYATADERVAEFRKAVGKDLDTLEREFLLYMRRVR